MEESLNLALSKFYLSSMADIVQDLEHPKSFSIPLEMRLSILKKIGERLECSSIRKKI
jgi:hypothetical protein